MYEAPACVGLELRQARQRRGKSLADMSSALKISKDYLTALEMGRFADLPSRVYAVGYVKSCAAYLGLDGADLVARFKTELASAGISEPDLTQAPRSERELPPKEESDTRHEDKPARISLPSFSAEALSQAAVVLIIVGAVSYSLYDVTASIPVSVPVPLTAGASVSSKPLATNVARRSRRAESPSLHEVRVKPPRIALRLAIHPPANAKFAMPAAPDSTKLASSESKSLPPPPRKQPRVSMPPSDSTKLASSGSKSLPPPPPKQPRVSLSAPDSTKLASSESKPLPPPPRNQPRVSVPRSRPIVEPDQDVVAQPVSLVREEPPAPTMRPWGQHYGESTKYSRITLRLHRPTAIRVADRRNRILIDRELEAGDTFRVPDISGVRLSALDGGAIEIILDNTTIGFAARYGVPAREISLEPKTIRRFAHSR